MSLNKKQARMVALALAGEQLIGRGLARAWNSANARERWGRRSAPDELIKQQLMDLIPIIHLLDIAGWAEVGVRVSAIQARSCEEGSCSVESTRLLLLQELVRELDSYSLPGYHFTIQPCSPRGQGDGWWGWWPQEEAGDE